MEYLEPELQSSIREGSRMKEMRHRQCFDEGGSVPSPNNMTPSQPQPMQQQPAMQAPQAANPMQSGMAAALPNNMHLRQQTQLASNLFGTPQQSTAPAPNIFGNKFKPTTDMGMNYRDSRENDMNMPGNPSGIRPKY